MKGRKNSKAKPPTADANPQNLTADPPPWLSEYAQEVWRETIADLESEGRPINRLNRQAFVGFCEAAATIREAGDVIAKEGYLIEGGRDGRKRNPAISIRQGALQTLRAYAESLGMTPASAGRLPAATHAADHAASEEIRRSDPHLYAAYLAEHGRPPTNIFECL